MNEQLKKLHQDIELELTNTLNSFVESTSFDEEDIIYAIKRCAKEMRY